MKKALLTKLMLLLCALIAGSSSAWADSWVKTAPADLKTGDVVVLVDLTSAKAMSNDNGTSSAPSAVDVTVSDDKITSAVADNIQWTVTASGSGDSRTYQLSTGENYLYVTATNNGVRVGSGERNTFTIVTGGENDGYYLYNENEAGDKRFIGCYNESNWRCYGSINNNIKVNNNAFFKKVASSNPSCATPTFSPEAGTYTSAQNVTISCETGGATIHYTLDGTDPTEASTVYSPSISITSTTTIKAKAYKDGMDPSGVASATYKIVSIAHAGTEADPYSVDDARTAIDLGTGTEGVYATGIVSKIVTAYNDTYGNISFNFSTDGATESDQLQAYRCVGIENVTDASKVAVGDVVVVRGNLTLYGSTYEFAQGCELVSLQKSSTDPVINAKDVTIEADATSGEIAYTIENPTTAELQASTTADWISNINVTTDKVTFKATANTGAQRTATITLSYTGAEDLAVTVTQKKYDAAATLPFEFDGGSADIASTLGLTQTGLGSYGSSPKLKFDGTGDELVLRINEVPGALTFDIKGNGFSSGSISTFKVQTSVDGIEYDDLATYTELGATQTELFNLLSNVRYIKWIYTEKGANSGGNVALGNIKLGTKFAVQIGEAGFVTFWSMRNHDFTGLSAYVLPTLEGDHTKLQKVTTAPAYTGLIIAGEPGIHELEETDSPAAVGDNLLSISRGFNVAGEAPDYNYFVLAKKNDNLGFYLLADGEKVPNGKCFLIIPKSNGSSEFIGLDFDGEATDINVVKGEEFMVNGEIYNLNGQRVAQPTKGLYIVNGKKVVIK